MWFRLDVDRLCFWLTGQLHRAQGVGLQTAGVRQGSAGVSYTYRIGLPHHPALILTDRSTSRRIVFPNGTVHPLTAAQTTFVNVGTMPKGSTWSLMVRHLHEFISHLFAFVLAFSRFFSPLFAHVRAWWLSFPPHFSLGHWLIDCVRCSRCRRRSSGRAASPAPTTTHPRL